MRSRDWAVIGAAAAACAGLYLMRHRDDGASPPAPPRPERAPAPVGGPAPAESHPTESLPPVSAHLTQTPAPALPALASPTGASPGTVQNLAQVFAAQPRDDRWAATTESEIRRRTSGLRDVQLSDLACKTWVCKLVISGSTGAVATASDALGSPHVFRTWVTALVLSTPTLSEGSAAVTAYVTFPQTVPNPPDD